MNDPSEEGGAARKALTEHPSGDDEAEKRRQYVAANRDRIRELNRLWRSEHLDRARELNRDSMRRAAARRHREAELRARGRERAKRWREEHPERRREYQQRWVTENREKVREYYNRYYAAHRDEVNARAVARRDADPERTKQITLQWAERNKERRAELQRNRRSDPEVYQSELEANAAARRLKRSLSRAGLPPKHIHVATAAERRANEREADAYFNDPSRPEHLRQFTVFAESLTEHMLKNSARMREFAEAYEETRARMGLSPVPDETIVYARAVEIVAERMRRVDLLTGRDVAAAVRSTKAEVRCEERQRQFDGLVKALVAHAHRHFCRFIEVAAMENLARTQRAKPRVAVESLIVHLAMPEVIHHLPMNRLASADVQNAIHAAALRVDVRADSDALIHGRAYGRSSRALGVDRP
ncbi:hypothetical protein E3O25_10910 [Cryobacterium sp. TMT1-3]|uniref:Uncharacterized protein n=1 Tax=Cryobacterium luteum TaxID=1424661 RepID=A0A1H8F5F8_9MICO|nr:MULTISPECIES: hypothetical protein [Cryobacterium]TFB85517.1 hypothetical protein E3O10_15415 [Cryobacterium luteum]TFC26578.1 hypothetical protein E3O25_10910 [Cryobacterium sp. TMT1-3]SEN27023.1 hypothetical protein SAMN05216281_105195 [Cryobacterium luteum]